MDRELKRSIILDNYQNPYHRLRHDEDDYLKLNSRNVSCIDNIDVYIKIKDGVIEDISFEGEACVISISSTSIMASTLVGKTIDKALKIIENYDDMIEEKNVQNEKIDEAKIDNIIIYIIGGVRKEGVYELPDGSRISDAIEQAEGLKENADTSGINLAYKLEDGMKIKIPLQGEKVENSININSTDVYMTKSSGLDTENSNVNLSGSAQKKQQKININKATQEELETLSGIGPSIANKIVQYRKENGNFKSVEDIKNVSGIGDNKFNEIKDSIVVK